MINKKGGFMSIVATHQDGDLSKTIQYLREGNSGKATNGFSNSELTEKSLNQLLLRFG
jgi:hypothetical protein